MPSRAPDHDPGRPPVEVGRLGGRSGVADIQRARIVAAIAEIARERGVGGTTVQLVVERSGVSRRTFYEQFEDRDDCLRAAFDEAVGRAAKRVLPAYRAQRAWRERMRAGLLALLEFLEEEPELGALCVVDVMGAGPAVLERRTEVVEALIDAVEEGAKEARAGLRPTRLTAEGVVGGVLAVLYARLSRVGRPGPGGEPPEEAAAPAMVGLLPQLMAMVVLPYHGNAAAAREGAKPAPRSRRALPRRTDPLRTLDLRLTYRTVRVLRAIAESPGASNRPIGDAAGIGDPGQISKLLMRLEQHGLIRNDGAGPFTGAPNVWSLTPKGEELERTIRQ
jgi:AcrR family transcriptional regulator/DNA-binding MarR family transcriptional regulator